MRILLTILLLTPALVAADEPFIYDNGLEKWNTTNSAFGRWAYRAFRIRRTHDGKFIGEMNSSEEISGPSTNAPRWIVATKKEREKPSDVRHDLFRALVSKKGICDAFET